MKQTITIREYAKLTTAEVVQSLDVATVSASAFDWLCKLSASFRSSGAQLLQVEGRTSLKWDSYVGVVQTPCGTCIEILPKHYTEGECIERSRELMQKLIRAALNIRNRKTSGADLQLYDAPLSEWVMTQFLTELDRLIKHGMRFDYRQIEEEQRFLRGRLNVAAQIRQGPARQHYFQISHHVFTPDRVENRLIRSALELVANTTQDPGNWRLAYELRSMLTEIPASKQIEMDFRAWSNDRLMAHYQEIKPWCEIILRQQMPLAVSGDWHGISFLFPMEVLFENYVGVWLDKNIQSGVKLKKQGSGLALCKHQEHKMFYLKPDFVLDEAQNRWIIDTKWKRIDGSGQSSKYWLSQNDFYQLYAYGNKYSQSTLKPTLLLVYPKWQKMQGILPVFDFDNGLNLYVCAFDLEEDQLMLSESLQLPLVC